MAVSFTKTSANKEAVREQSSAIVTRMTATNVIRAMTKIVATEMSTDVTAARAGKVTTGTATKAVVRQTINMDK